MEAGNRTGARCTNSVGQGGGNGAGGGAMERVLVMVAALVSFPSMRDTGTKGLMVPDETEATSSVSSRRSSVVHETVDISERKAAGTR